MKLAPLLSLTLLTCILSLAGCDSAKEPPPPPPRRPPK
jgi:hypothetical protein